MLFCSRVRVRVRTTLIVWLVRGYAHVFVLFSVVIVTRPVQVDKLAPWSLYNPLSSRPPLDPAPPPPPASYPTCCGSSDSRWKVMTLSVCPSMHRRSLRPLSVPRPPINPAFMPPTGMRERVRFYYAPPDTRFGHFGGLFWRPLWLRTTATIRVNSEIRSSCLMN